MRGLVVRARAPEILRSCSVLTGSTSALQLGEIKRIAIGPDACHGDGSHNLPAKHLTVRCLVRVHSYEYAL